MGRLFRRGEGFPIGFGRSRDRICPAFVLLALEGVPIVTYKASETLSVFQVDIDLHHEEGKEILRITIH